MDLLLFSMDNDFDSVSWQRETETNTSGPVSGSRPDLNGKRRSSNTIQQAAEQADAVDLGGIGEGRLDCTVNKPSKENDGTKDSYVSYLVTTHVRQSRIS